ncbi:MAG: hypothetical protein D6786_00520 [Gammaproteobacteria bacterium]|nr:MAG: hypothetical protein D6786_00520 [Gammaproteobacteria bacterium]
MTLIAILLVLLVEYLMGPLEDLRRWNWFRVYTARMQRHLGRFELWQGPVGVLVVLALPLVLIALVLEAVGDRSLLLGFLLGLLILLYALGPQDLGRQLREYLAALESGDQAAASRMAYALLEDSGLTPGEQNGRDVAGAVMVLACERLFGAFFWFTVLGPTGALLYRMGAELERCAGADGGFAGAARDLHRILQWPAARLLALGYALAGSMTHALAVPGWREWTNLDASHPLLRDSGLAALRPEAGETDERELVAQAWELVKRALLLWLTLLALLTLAGWVG